MRPALRDALARVLGSELARDSAADGGEMSAITLTDGRRLFVKASASAPTGMYACEARGLQWLARARAIRVPEVAFSGDCGAGECIVLEQIASGRPAHDYDERLGRGLAELHREGAERFGLDYDNFIAVLPQENAPCASFAEFYAQRRIRPQLQRARRAGLIDAALSARIEGLIDRLPDLVGPPEPPARLHGDLWSGNVLCDENGAPCLIDPAVYGGQREIDLAMMRLFGGFSERVFDAYNEAFPLAAGHRERVALFQVYPLLVHVNLFGGGYVRQLQSLIARWV